VATDLLTFPQRDPHADVLLVTSGWPHPGNPTYCIFIKRQVDSLRQAGLECDVLFINGYRSKAAYLLAAARLAIWNLSPPRDYRLVYAQTGEAALVASFYRRAPLLVTYYGSDLLGRRRRDDSISLQNRVRTALVRQHARLARRTITQSRQMESVLPASVRSRNAVIPNGIDTTLFRPLDRGEVRRRFGWPAEARVALFLASPAVACKRFWLAEAACAVARLQLPDLRLHVASGVPPDDVPLLLNAADCLLLTSSSEGSPNAIKEAVMCNLPVIATRVGDVAEVLDGVEPSFVCDDSEDALADALVACLAEPRRSNGRSVAGWLADDAIAQRVLALVRELSGSQAGHRQREPLTGR
jgi:glycosyltransferase involved in cell wall biosynthesis